MSKVLVVDDKQMMRDSVTTTLVRAGLQAVAADSGEAALTMIAKHRPSAVVTDLKMPNMDGIELLKRIQALDPQLPVVLMTAYATIDTAVSAMKEGAFDYIQKPFEGDELIMTVKRAMEHARLTRENEAMKANGGQVLRAVDMIGQTAVMEQLKKQMERIAASHGTVLIAGESGTGKEVVARMLHSMSPRQDEVFLAVNCAALSANLLESELFGHEKGAFTGADQLRKGRFELAESGTLLLDEVSEISPELQAKLLRVLQERQFERVGSSVTMDIDVRVIATTNRDLETEAREGEFRQDLYFRLNVLPIHLPPLRSRKEDIPLLAEHFLMQQAMRDGREARKFDEEAMRVLKDYVWPGNVRELQNICERAGVLSPDVIINAGLIQPWLTGSGGEVGSFVAEDMTLEDMEREMIIRSLGKYEGHRQRTADALGISVRTLGMKLKKWKDENLIAQSL